MESISLNPYEDVTLIVVLRHRNPENVVGTVGVRYAGGCNRWGGERDAPAQGLVETRLGKKTRCVTLDAWMVS